MHGKGEDSSLPPSLPSLLPSLPLTCPHLPPPFTAPLPLPSLSPILISLLPSLLPSPSPPSHLSSSPSSLHCSPPPPLPLTCPHIPPPLLCYTAVHMPLVGGQRTPLHNLNLIWQLMENLYIYIICHMRITCTSHVKHKYTVEPL